MRDPSDSSQPSSPSPSALMSAQDVADELQITDDAARRVMRDVGLIRLSPRRMRVRREALNSWLAGLERAARAALAPPPPPSTSSPEAKAS